LPKTFFYLALSPRKTHAYVIEELQKKPEDRYDHFTPPLIFWSIVGILPHFMLLSLYAADPTIRKLLAGNTNVIVARVLTLSADVRGSSGIPGLQKKGVRITSPGWVAEGSSHPGRRMFCSIAIGGRIAELLVRVNRSMAKKVMEVIGEDETVAGAVGIRVTRFKMVLTALSAHHR
jgi:ABC-type branched-subunit amino acid transport system permease subunit